MTIKETNEFMERIKSHYQEFIIDDFKIKEWHKELQKYASADVNKKFEEHLKSSEYGEYIPKLYFLTKNLIEEKDKGKIKKYIIKCQLCDKDVPDELYDEHYKKCSGAKTIVRDMKNYFNLTVDYEQIMKLSDLDYERTCDKYLNKMLEAKDLPAIRKKVILQCLYPGKDLAIEDLLKEWK